MLLIIGIFYLVNRPARDTYVIINNKMIKVEVANTPALQELGLMNRKSLPEYSGMLFVFDQVNAYAFWMKNTLIPLDMLWVDENKKIVDIQTAQPCVTTTCKTYIPRGLAKYVLEVNAGWAQKNNVNIGDTMEIKVN